MDPWNMWTWPWAATIEMWRRSLVDLEAAADDGTSPREEPQWATHNHTALELAGLRVRDFSSDGTRTPIVVVTPFALHDAQLADLATGQSLVEALLRNDSQRLYLVEWKSATPATCQHTIDTLLSSLNVVIDDIGRPVDIIGLCQGGWLSLVYAARFQQKVRRIVLVGAPIDFKAEASALSAPIESTSDIVIEQLIRRGGGVIRGRDMAKLWPRESDENLRLTDSLQIPAALASEAARQTVEAFQRWDRRALDLPGPYYRQVVSWLYRENRLAAGTFPALGRKIDLRILRRPLFLLAGAKDPIAPPAQAFAAAKLIGSGDIEMALAPCGHLALFMGRDTLHTEWPRIAQWLLK